ncbi:adenosylcobinamide-GDP ribazoletransferase [Geosporobacter ferrireducens]|uniref:Adenosylcobinamide-GDP ribazoletransferase n=1 Tax=Geosporobacter ferrireducens TaxID=1424294 RepID=A0A1D8GNA5_9FIRM|nr:adenosylcobinamide-GDP ribazoletransferase [Geosporobacter ferrireducens]AOT72375.1 cobalamin 5'-phosphate synthase [Geosporobacter ferrireducens]MTI56369.1 adenosylcobinamide-GDP ribazoletransferase [Geosporobacter ferrireducens]
MKRLILMIQFLTRIPIQVQLEVEERDFLDGVIYFPLVGLIIGMFVLSFYHLGLWLGGSFLAAVMAVAIEVFITGGLHLDGLGDTFDGIYSNRPKDRILEIMKDSRLGTNAALAILITLLLKIAFIANIDPPRAAAILLLMPVFSRFILVFSSRYAKYARPNGMGNLYIGKVTNRQLQIAGVITLGCCLINLWSIPFMVIGCLFSLLYIHHITGKIDGMTGDTLGALCELMELVYLFYFLVVLNLIW